MGIARLRGVEYESESAFAVENGAHSWTDIHAIDAVMQTSQVAHPRAENKSRLTEKSPAVLGRKSGSRLTFGHYLVGDGVPLTSAASPANDSLQNLLELSMGGSTSAAGSQTAAGCTTSVINVTAGQGSKFSAGMAIMVEDAGGAGINEMSIIESVSTDALTLKHALSNAPSSGLTVWNSYTAYLDPSATATGQFRCVRDHTASIWLALGAVGGFTLQDLLQFEAGQLPKIMFDLLVTKWEQDTGALAAGSYDGADPLITSAGMECHYQTHGTATRNLISVSQINLGPGHTWTQLMARGNGDVEHVDRVRMTGVEPVVDFTADPSTAFLTAQAARTEKALALMFGRTPGSSWIIEIPKFTIDNPPEDAEHAEQNAQRVVGSWLEDDCGAADSALTRSPFRIHRL